MSLVGATVSSPALGAPAFSDRTDAANLTASGESYGASFGDLNGDGYLDIYTSNHRLPDALHLNMRDGTFYRISSQVLPWRFHKHADTHGGTFADIDNDGDQDLLIGTGVGNPEQLLYNESQRLVDRTAEKGLTTLDLGGRQAVWLDFDNDRLLDFVMTQFDGNSRLYHQDADGTFTDQTDTAKLSCPNVHYGELYDANDDGTLDFLCPDQDVYPLRIYETTSMPWPKIFESTNPNHTWFPRVDGVVDSVIADFDNDGRQDIFLLSNQQLHPSAVAASSPTHFESLLANGNKGIQFVSGGRITITTDWNRADEQSTRDLTKIEIGANAVHPSSINFTLDPADPNVVGMPPAPTAETTLPIMQIGYDPSTQQWTLMIQTRLNQTDKPKFSVAYLQVASTSEITGLERTGDTWPGESPARPTLLMNRPGSYVDETVNARLDTPVSCVSATAGDFDNDMDIDLYLACRNGASNIANILYENLGNGTFKNVSTGFGAEGPVGVAVASGAGTADSVISGDYDVDGFLDLFVTNGLNLQPLYSGGPNKLFHNNGNANHWVEIDLVGTASDRDATGAKLYASAGGVTQLRVQNGAYHRWSQDAKRAHFGLAGNATVDLRVVWPGGNEQTFNDMPANTLYRITENTGIDAVTPGVAPAYPCGSPATNGTVDKGVFVWRDCATGQWSMRVMSANDVITYQGTITSTGNFTSFRPRALEPNDVLDTSNPKQIGFTFNSRGTGFDGVDFKLPDGANTYLEIAAPSGAQLFMGPFKTPISAPADLEAPLPRADLGFALPNASVGEAGGAVVLNVSRSGAAGGAVSVNFATSSGSAAAGADFTSASGTLTWADGDASDKTITVNVTNDSEDESEETFSVSLSDPSAGTPLGTYSTTTVTIADDDAPSGGGDGNGSGGGGNGGGGGGGALDWLIVALLTRLALGKRRHV